MLRKVLWPVFLLLAIFLFSDLSAQAALNPIFTESHQEFTITAEGGYFRRQIYNIDNKSPILTLKATLGLAEKFDLFARVGAANLSLTLADSANSVFEDEYHLAYGGGFSWRLWHHRRLRLALLTGAQFFRFKSSPERGTPFSISETEILQILEMQYDWREFSTNVGLTKGLGFLTMFFGVNARIIQRKEARVEKLLFGTDPVSVEAVSGRYTSGVLMDPSVGIDLDFGHRFKLSAEATGRNRSDLAIYFSLSQTGRPR
jgi:hypothetical protein